MFCCKNSNIERSKQVRRPPPSTYNKPSTNKPIPLIKIIHFNDAYEIREREGEGIVGGVSRFASLISSIKNQSEALVFFSGDLYSPNKRKIFS